MRHNQAVRPIPGDINPYHLGFKLWQDIRRRADEPTAEEIETYGAAQTNGRSLIFAVREVDRDVSFLRRFLTKEMIRELGLFQYEQHDEDLVATKVADDDNWRDVKGTLLRSVGMGGIPVIRVHDADHGRRGELLLCHEHDGRDLHLDYAEKTLAYARRLWGRNVTLETRLDGAPCRLKSHEDGFAIEEDAA